ncbi:hypothetical protein HOH87_01435 [bacterium]|jgi:hypothetical protein|nr:hypothetical protein [bacterium]
MANALGGSFNTPQKGTGRGGTQTPGAVPGRAVPKTPAQTPAQKRMPGTPLIRTPAKPLGVHKKVSKEMITEDLSRVNVSNREAVHKTHEHMTDTRIQKSKSLHQGPRFGGVSLTQDDREDYSRARMQEAIQRSALLLGVDMLRGRTAFLESRGTEKRNINPEISTSIWSLSLSGSFNAIMGQVGIPPEKKSELHIKHEEGKPVEKAKESLDMFRDIAIVMGDYSRTDHTARLVTNTLDRLSDFSSRFSEHEVKAFTHGALRFGELLQSAVDNPESIMDLDNPQIQRMMTFFHNFHEKMTDINKRKETWLKKKGVHEIPSPEGDPNLVKSFHKEVLTPFLEGDIFLQFQQELAEDNQKGGVELTKLVNAFHLHMYQGWYDFLGEDLAFQGVVDKALNLLSEKGISPDLLDGTSIGNRDVDPRLQGNLERLELLNRTPLLSELMAVAESLNESIESGVTRSGKGGHVMKDADYVSLARLKEELAVYRKALLSENQTEVADYGVVDEFLAGVSRYSDPRDTDHNILNVSHLTGKVDNIPRQRFEKYQRVADRYLTLQELVLSIERKQGMMTPDVTDDEHSHDVAKAKAKVSGFEPITETIQGSMKLEWQSLTIAREQLESSKDGEGLDAAITELGDIADFRERLSERQRWLMAQLGVDGLSAIRQAPIPNKDEGDQSYLGRFVDQVAGQLVTFSELETMSVTDLSKLVFGTAVSAVDLKSKLVVPDDAAEGVIKDRLISLGTLQKSFLTYRLAALRGIQTRSSDENKVLDGRKALIDQHDQDMMSMQRLLKVSTEIVQGELPVSAAVMHTLLSEKNKRVDGVDLVDQPVIQRLFHGFKLSKMPDAPFKMLFKEGIGPKDLVAAINSDYPIEAIKRLFRENVNVGGKEMHTTLAETVLYTLQAVMTGSDKALNGEKFIDNKKSVMGLREMVTHQFLQMKDSEGCPIALRRPNRSLEDKNLAHLLESRILGYRLMLSHEMEKAQTQVTERIENFDDQLNSIPEDWDRHKGVFESEASKQWNAIDIESMAIRRKAYTQRVMQVMESGVQADRAKAGVSGPDSLAVIRAKVVSGEIAFDALSVVTRIRLTPGTNHVLLGNLHAELKDTLQSLESGIVDTGTTSGALEWASSGSMMETVELFPNEISKRSLRELCKGQPYTVNELLSALVETGVLTQVGGSQSLHYRVIIDGDHLLDLPSKFQKNAPIIREFLIKKSIEGRQGKVMRVFSEGQAVPELLGGEGDSETRRLDEYRQLSQTVSVGRGRYQKSESMSTSTVNVQRQLFDYYSRWGAEASSGVVVNKPPPSYTLTPKVKSVPVHPAEPATPVVEKQTIKAKSYPAPSKVVPKTVPEKIRSPELDVSIAKGFDKLERRSPPSPIVFDPLDLPEPIDVGPVEVVMDPNLKPDEMALLGPMLQYASLDCKLKIVFEYLHSHMVKPEAAGIQTHFWKSVIWPKLEQSDDLKVLMTTKKDLVEAFCVQQFQALMGDFVDQMDSGETRMIDMNVQAEEAGQRMAQREAGFLVKGEVPNGSSAMVMKDANTMRDHWQMVKDIMFQPPGGRLPLFEQLMVQSNQLVADEHLQELFGDQIARREQYDVAVRDRFVEMREKGGQLNSRLQRIFGQALTPLPETDDRAAFRAIWTKVDPNDRIWLFNIDEGLYHDSRLVLDYGQRGPIKSPIPIEVESLRGLSEMAVNRRQMWDSVFQLLRKEGALGLPDDEWFEEIMRQKKWDAIQLSKLEAYRNSSWLPEV